MSRTNEIDHKERNQEFLNYTDLPKAYVRSIHTQLSRSLGKRMEWIAIRDHDFDTQTLLDPN